jgi:HD-like signal output (HDOD) protein
MQRGLSLTPESGETWERIRKCQLPKPPSVVIQLLEVARSETDLKKPAEIISREPSLAAEILTIVNSPWFDLKREIRTIHHAVALLGVDAVCSLASAFALRDSLIQFDRSRFDYGHYWRRSVLAATAARVLATSVEETDSEEVFLAALLQDIGMLVLAQAFPGTYPELMKESAGDHMRLSTLEENELGAGHVEIGLWLAEVWNLPQVFRAAIAASHDQVQRDADDHPAPLVSCVALSGPLADLWGNPDTQAALRAAQSVADSLLGLDQEALHTVLVATAKGFRKAAEIFKVPMEGPDKIHQVLAKVLQALSSEAKLSVELTA